ncbi:DUF4407 domain-containing protein [Belliella kenyensis]|uniref:DUF4407 domain-containing protein n=1 Tax=Belliella kenyensis TaxID=1472724 RepID=A0ABV8ELJ5_9BACT|nr:DUF4407 domain-containing protein [Belliella kenyensis]MCH7400597.1 DUF4407 domain-containing protein [Belliella kenyensis]MDN3602116.1 DUF4407 domain-containing protein [Belliella kenyensis]
MNNLKRFLWFCSGANFNLLKRTPTESSKYVGIGGTVLFTGILASLSAGYALFTVFQSLWYAVGFGVLWGLMIFNLDRFIVSSMRKEVSKKSEWKMAIPRFMMAIILALVISKPLELKIFEREINRELDKKKIEMVAESKAKIALGFPEVLHLEVQKDSLKAELKAMENFRDQLQKEYDLERFGVKTSGSSGIVGLGTNAKKKEQQLDAAQRDLDQFKKEHQVRIDKIDDRLVELSKIKEAEFAKIQPQIDGFDGMAARIDALSAISSQSESVKLANLMIVLLFIAVETAPIFVKLISPVGPYDRLLGLTEKKVEVYVHEKTTLLVRESEWRLENC